MAAKKELTAEQVLSKKMKASSAKSLKELKAKLAEKTLAEKVENAKLNGAYIEASENDGREPNDIVVADSLLTDILNGVHGLNVKGRLAYTLNMTAQRMLRDAVKATLKPLADNNDGLLTDDELSEMFGMEIKPIYTVNQCCHWVMLSYVIAHDVAKHTEADEQGRKSNPYAWMQELIKTPITMIINDREYGVSSSIGKQAANMAKLGIESSAGIEKFEAVQRENSLEVTKSKLDIVRGSYNNKLYVASPESLGTEEVQDEIAEFIAITGLNIEAMVTEIAIKSYEKSVSNANEGKFLGDIDEQLLEFLPKHYKQQIQKQQAKQRPPVVMDKPGVSISGIDNGPLH